MRPPGQQRPRHAAENDDAAHFVPVVAQLLPRVARIARLSVRLPEEHEAEHGEGREQRRSRDVMDRRRPGPPPSRGSQPVRRICWIESDEDRGDAGRKRRRTGLGRSTRCRIPCRRRERAPSRTVSRRRQVPPLRCSSSRSATRRSSHLFNPCVSLAPAIASSTTGSTRPDSPMSRRCSEVDRSSLRPASKKGAKSLLEGVSVARRFTAGAGSISLAEGTSDSAIRRTSPADGQASRRSLESHARKYTVPARSRPASAATTLRAVGDRAVPERRPGRRSRRR